MYIITGKIKILKRETNMRPVSKLNCLNVYIQLHFIVHVFTQSVNKHDNIYHDVNKLK